jgi:hypothetical protein
MRICTVYLTDNNDFSLDHYIMPQIQNMTEKYIFPGSSSPDLADFTSLVRLATGHGRTYDQTARFEKRNAMDVSSCS